MKLRFRKQDAIQIGTYFYYWNGGNWSKPDWTFDIYLWKWIISIGKQ